MSKHTGGWAFAHGDPTNGGDPGMTLRDYFAGQALAGLAARDLLGDGCGELQRRCYAIADAMLVERTKDGAA